MEIEEAFGRVLREERKFKKISQEKLAFICNLDRTYISLMERGKRKPTINTLFSLSKGLEVSPSELILKTERLVIRFQKDE